MQDQKRGPGRPREITGTCQTEGCQGEAKRRAHKPTKAVPSPPCICHACYQRGRRQRATAEAKPCSWPRCRNRRQWNRQSATRPGYCAKHEHEYLANHHKLDEGLDLLASVTTVGPNGCLTYMRAPWEHPRGSFSFGARSSQWLPYRFAYLAAVGPVPARKQLDHLCGNPLCVAVTHLEPVSPEKNVRRHQKRAEGEMDQDEAIQRRTAELLADEATAAGVARLARIVHPQAPVWATLDLPST